MIQAPGPCIIKLITAIINSVTKKASVFVQAIKKVTAHSFLHYRSNYGCKKFYDTGP
jgi:hypothetical protein